MQAALGIHVVIFIDSIGMRETHDMNGEQSLFPSSKWHEIFLLYAPFNMANFYLSMIQILTHNNHYFFAASSDIVSHGGRSKYEPVYAFRGMKELGDRLNTSEGVWLMRIGQGKEKKYPSGTLDHGHSKCFKWGGKVFVTPARTHQKGGGKSWLLYHGGRVSCLANWMI